MAWLAVADAASSAVSVASKFAAFFSRLGDNSILDGASSLPPLLRILAMGESPLYWRLTGSCVLSGARVTMPGHQLIMAWGRFASTKSCKIPVPHSKGGELVRVHV